MKSWKTTASGIIALLTLAGGVFTSLTDGNALTNPDWTAVIAGATAAFGLLFARDNKVTSEQAGAVK